MSNTFWTNTIWYIALFATSVSALAIVFIKTTGRKKAFAFFFAVLGLAYWMEVLLVLFLHAYAYMPMITEDIFFDTVLGNIFSQVSVSSSAVLICTLGLSNWWLLGFSAAYFLIDLLFSSLGIYVHHWYRSVYTLAGFFIFGSIVKYWYNTFYRSPSKKLSYVTLFLSAFAITSNLLGTALRFFAIRIFQAGLFPDPSRDHTATTLIYMPVLVMISMALSRRKTPWFWKGSVFLLLFICQYGLVQSGIMIVRPGWQVIVLLLDLAVFYSVTVVMDTWLDTGNTAFP